MPARHGVTEHQFLRVGRKPRHIDGEIALGRDSIGRPLTSTGRLRATEKVTESPILRMPCAEAVDLTDVT